MIQKLSGAGSLVALVAAITALVFQFLPQLKPDPREKVGADVEVFRVEPGVTIPAWLHRVASGKEYRRKLHEFLGPHPDRAERGVHGELVYVRTTVDGYKHRRVSLRLRMYDAASQVPLGHLPFDDISKAPLKIDAPSRRSVQLLWIPELSVVKRSFVRVELLDTKGMLAVGDSAVLIRGLMPQVVTAAGN